MFYIRYMPSVSRFIPIILTHFNWVSQNHNNSNYNIQSEAGNKNVTTSKRKLKGKCLKRD